MFQISFPLFQKLFQSKSMVDLVIAIFTITALTAIPLTCLLLLFFQKEIIVYRNENLIEINKRFLFFTIKSKKLRIKGLEVKHFLSSPNMAKIQSTQSTKAFQNRGHYLLELTDEKGQLHLIDRHTNKADLVGLKNLIEQELV